MNLEFVPAARNFVFMAFLKFQADQLFTGSRMLPGNHVLIMDADGTVLDLIPDSMAGEDVLQLNGILSPGFVNAHCHLELSHMKDVIPPGTGMVDFLLGILQQRKAGEAAIREAMIKAESDMLQAGIVAVGDICNTPHSLFLKQAGRLHYHSFIEVSGFSPAVVNDRFNSAETLWRLYQASAHDRHKTSLVPHAPYSVAPALFERIKELPDTGPISMHSQESKEEDLFFKQAAGDMTRLYQQLNISLDFFKASGKSSLQTVLPYLPKNRPLILVHNVTMEQEDLQAMETTFNNQSDVFICLCPNANLYINGKLPDISLLRKAKYPLLLGTDSLASNQQLSILAEMQTLQSHFAGISLEELFTWATLNGARALQMDDILGSFEPGHKPGLLLVDTGLAKLRRLL